VNSIKENNTVSLPMLEDTSRRSVGVRGTESSMKERILLQLPRRKGAAVEMG
jgi:hypothetical protein